MVIQQSSNGYFTITLQADAGVLPIVYAYTRSMTMLRVKRETNPQICLVTVNVAATGVTAKTTNYYTDPDGVLQLSLHNDVCRMAALGVSQFAVTLTFTELDGTTVDGNLAFTVVPRVGISYEDALAPRNKDFTGTLYAFSPRCILPPNVMLNPTMLNGLTAPGIIVESNYHSIDSNAVWSQYASGVGTTVTPYGGRSNQLAVAAGADTLRLVTGDESDIVKDYKLANADYCADIVCCRWTSLTGAVRQHCFPIKAYVKGNGEQVALVSPADGYEVAKGNYNALRCRLSGLTAYGYWYYMDMLQASDLHAVVVRSIQQWETLIKLPSTAAFIDSSSVETPTGTGFFNFDFTLNMRQYDKV